MATATDVLRAKTDAELQFFVESPTYYHPDLVAAARQELRRRGLAPTPAAGSPLDDLPAEATPSRRGLLLVLGALGLAGVGGTFWWAGRRRSPWPPAARATSRPIR